MKRFLLAAFAASLAGTSALAAPPAPAFNWTGFYAGVNGGGGWGHTPYSWPTDGDGFAVFAPFPGGGSFKQNLNGAAAGGHVGYNSQLYGNWIWGMEASLDWSNIKGFSANEFPGAVVGGSTYHSKLEWFGTVTSRLGYAWDNWLVYGRFGTAAGEVRTSLSNPLGPITEGERKDHLGLAIGGGIEYAIARNWIFGVEYNYYDLGGQRYGGVPRVGGASAAVSSEYHLDPRFSVVTARLSYKFDDPRSVAAMPVKAPVYSTNVWQGSYGGVHAGWGWGDTLYLWPFVGDTTGSFAPIVGGSFRQNLEGGLAGLHTGYNYQMGAWVLGLEGSLDWSGIKGSSANAFAAGLGVAPGAAYKADVRWLASVTPRIGYAANNWLVYAKAGLAGGEVRTRLTNSTTAGATGQDNDHIGWTAGAGIEYAWKPNWILGLEYDFYDLGDQRYGGVPTIGGAPVLTPNEYHLDPKFSTVLARLTYKFGN